MRTSLHAVLAAPCLSVCLSLAGGAALAYAPGKPAAPTKRVDINSATPAELKTLPGIGDAEAARIVAARPYPSKAKLVAEGVMTMATFTQLKDRIEARQPKVARNPHREGGQK